MNNGFTHVPDHTELIQRYAAQLYRLALLMSGNPRAAATLVEQAYAALPADAPASETALIQGLLPRRRAALRGWHAHASRAQADRAGIDLARADRLLGLLARRSPVERLVVGLHYMRGMGSAEITALLGEAAPHPAAVLAALRGDVARALGYAPAEADAATLAQLDAWLDGALDDDAMLAVRQRIFAEVAVRELRDALIAVRELLPRALPALFAASAPPALTERLLAHGAHPPAPRRARLTGVRLGLTLGVLALVAAIVFVPGLLVRRAPTTRASLAPAEVVAAATHRFDQALLQSGVLHERYRVEYAGETHIIERWYDYATPHRLAFTLRAADANAAPLLAISSDGASMIQYRYAANMRAAHPALDVRVTPQEAQAALPMLRNFSSTRMLPGPRDITDIGPLYLSQARANNVRSLGETVFLGRPAFLLTYDNTPKPGEAAALPAGRVLLTIDAQTYTLLDVAVLPTGAAESTAQHPLRADLIEVLDSAPEAVFTQPSDASTVSRAGLTSVYLPTLVEDRLLTLADAAQRTQNTLLVPQQLPDAAMHGFALNGRRDNDVVLVYEGEFQSALLLPQAQWSSRLAADSAERSAGPFRYRLLSGFGDPNVALSAQVYRPEAPDQRVVAVLFDSYATAAEREARLAQVIASLTPLTPQNILRLQEQFYPAVTAGG